MATYTGGRRSFPALLIVFLLFLACLFPGQGLITRLPLLSGIAGLARLHVGLIIFDIPIRLPVTIDLILVPVLFLLIYTLIICVYPARGGMPAGRAVVRRLGAVGGGLFMLLFCVGLAGAVAYLLQGYLPRQVRNGVGSIGVNADVELPYKTIHLHGNVIVLVGLVVGMVIFIGKIMRPVGQVRRRVRPLTREQRMTPYQRMLEERRKGSGALAGGGSRAGSGATAAPRALAGSRTGSSEPRGSRISSGSRISDGSRISGGSRPSASPRDDSGLRTGGAGSRSDSSATVGSRGSGSRASQTLHVSAVSPVSSSSLGSPLLCRREAVMSLEPAAVNYMPLW